MKISKILGLFLLLGLFFFILNTLRIPNILEIKDNSKIENITDNVRYLNMKDIEITTDEWQVFSPVCFQSLPSDSNSFGKALAMNETRLANKICIEQLL